MEFSEEKTRISTQGFDIETNVGEAGDTNIEYSGPQFSTKELSSDFISSEQPYLSVIIPAYNEENRLPGTITNVLEYFEAQDYSTEVIIVDDGSVDNTVAIVQRLMGEREHLLNQDKKFKCELKLIEGEHRGKGYTVRHGMLAGTGQYLLFSDADLSTPISDVSKLLFWLEQGYDVAVGSREGHEAHRYNEPFYRHLMGRVFNLIVRVFTNSDLKDTQCGFKAFRQKACHELFSRLQLYGDSSSLVKGPMVTGFDVEVLFLAHKHGYKVKEVPVTWYHVGGSKVNPLKDSIRMVKDIVKVRTNDLRGKYKENDNRLARNR